MRRRYLVVTLLFIASLISIAFAPVQPAPAERTWLQITTDSDPVNFECGFPMAVRSTGKGMVHVYTDRYNRLTKVTITQASARMTFINLANGKSAWTPTAGMLEMDYDTTPTGSVVLVLKVFRGNGGRLVAPGGGLSWANVGVDVMWSVTFDSAGNLVANNMLYGRNGEPGQHFPLSAVHAVCPLID